MLAGKYQYKEFCQILRGGGAPKVYILNRKIPHAGRTGNRRGRPRHRGPAAIARSKLCAAAYQASLAAAASSAGPAPPPPPSAAATTCLIRVVERRASYRSSFALGCFSHFGGTKNGTSGAPIKILRPLFNTNQPPKPPKSHRRNRNRTTKGDFWPFYQFCIFLFRF